MNEYSDSFEFLQKHSSEFIERQVMSRVSDSIVECRWVVEGESAQWREILGDNASGWHTVAATPTRGKPVMRGQRVRVWIDAAAYDKALRIGDGDAGEGLRKALALFVERKQDMNSANGQSVDDPLYLVPRVTNWYAAEQKSQQISLRHPAKLRSVV